MKILTGTFLIILILFAGAGCTGKGSGKKSLKAENDTINVPDTGFTGIKKFYDYTGNYLIKEVTFENGIRQGLMKTFYQSGLLYQTFWYENDLREDSAKWYYEQGQVFRTTPYKHDTIDGIQRQFFRDGKVRAKIGYSKGLRNRSFQEFDKNGKIVGGYPDIVINISDEYTSRGIYHIGLELSVKNTKVKFWRGEFTEGRFDTLKCTRIKTIEGKGVLDLKKSGAPQPGSVGIIADILTPYGNRYLAEKKIALPYKDLK
jgi:hypothetical protein